MYKNFTLKSFFAVAIFASACSDSSDDVTPSAPSTYNFENVSYTGQTTRLGILGDLTTEMKKGNEGTAVSFEDLYTLYTDKKDGKEIKTKVHPAEQETFTSWFKELAKASQSKLAGESGVAGVVTSEDGKKKYLFDENGIEYTQLVEKGLMGALMYHQATAGYFGKKLVEADNEKVTEGKGTEMQHYWDEAFGYFPAVKNDKGEHVLDNSKYWGKYASKTDKVGLKSSEKILNAFIAGRHAIGQKDYTTRDAKIKEIRTEWELVSAGTAIHYLNAAKENIDDDALRNHELSEARAFIFSLRFNPDTKVDTKTSEMIIALLGTNFYDTDRAKINLVIEALAQNYPTLATHKDHL